MFIAPRSYELRAPAERNVVCTVQFTFRSDGWSQRDEGYKHFAPPEQRSRCNEASFRDRLQNPGQRVTRLARNGGL